MIGQMKNERSATGIEGLDDILGGGLTPRRLYLIEGDPGAGKTTLAMQYLLEGVRHGEKGLYITLSETRIELEAAAKSHGWTLEGLEVVELIASESELEGNSHLTMFHPSEVELGETTKLMLEAVNRINPVRVIFDSLSELRLLAQNPLRYRRQVLALKSFFAGRNCTVLLLDDRVTQGEDKQLQSIAHGVIQLEQLTPVYGAERRRIRVVKFRGSRYRGGYHDFSIRTGGIVVFPRLVASEHGQAMTQVAISSGNADLDHLLGGGVDRGTSTLFLGPAGSGKSTIAAQYAIAATHRGDHAAIFTFDESLTTLRNRMNSIGSRFKEGVEKGEVMLRSVDPAELTPGEFAHQVRESVERDNARVVVIDSLNGYLNSMPEEHFLTSQLHELLMFLGKKGVATMLVVAQHGIMGSTPAAPVDTSYLADSVILFRYFEDRGRVKKALSVVKKRSGQHEDTIREVNFDEAGIHLSGPLTQFRGILTGVPVLSGENNHPGFPKGGALP
jgi:circadian clock protein KaiC